MPFLSAPFPRKPYENQFCRELTDHREEVIEIMSRTFDAEDIAELDAPDDIHQKNSSEVDDIETKAQPH